MFGGVLAGCEQPIVPNYCYDFSSNIICKLIVSELQIRFDVATSTIKKAHPVGVGVGSAVGLAVGTAGEQFVIPCPDLGQLRGEREVRGGLS